MHCGKGAEHVVLDETSDVSCVRNVTMEEEEGVTYENERGLTVQNGMMFQDEVVASERRAEGNGRVVDPRLLLEVLAACDLVVPSLDQATRERRERKRKKERKRGKTRRERERERERERKG